jgi:hypothetical protein
MWAFVVLRDYARSLTHKKSASANSSVPVPKSKPERECARIGERP